MARSSGLRDTFQRNPSFSERPPHPHQHPTPASFPTLLWGPEERVRRNGRWCERMHIIFFPHHVLSFVILSTSFLHPPLLSIMMEVLSGHLSPCSDGMEKPETLLCKCCLKFRDYTIFFSFKFSSPSTLNLKMDHSHSSPPPTPSSVPWCPFHPSPDPWPPHKQPVLNQRWLIVSVSDVACVQPNVVTNYLSSGSFSLIFFHLFTPSLFWSSTLSSSPKFLSICIPHQTPPHYVSLFLMFCFSCSLPYTVLSKQLSIKANSRGSTLPRHVLSAWCDLMPGINVRMIEKGRKANRHPDADKILYWRFSSLLYLHTTFLPRHLFLYRFWFD